MKQKAIERTKSFIEDMHQKGYKSYYGYCHSLGMTKSQTNHWRERINDYKRELSSTSKDRTSIVRNDKGVIIGYRYNIKYRTGEKLEGTLSRDNMEKICSLYSMYGANLTNQQVHIEFPELSLCEFQKIRTAFMIFKYSCPFPIHIIEEHTDDELRDMSAKRKRNSLVRNMERNQIKDVTDAAKKIAAENIILKNRKTLLSSLLSDAVHSKIGTYFKGKQEKWKKNVPLSDDCVIIWLSDIHVGAYNNKFGFYNLDIYTKVDINKRLDMIVDFFKNENIKTIYIMNLGDSVDSFNKETTRGGHELPTIMTNKEIATCYMEVMARFFSNMKKTHPESDIRYYCIGESNHGGDFDWITNIALSKELAQNGIECYVSDYPIDHVQVSGKSFIYLHGKDIANQIKPFPLTLNDKTELYFSNYINENNIKGNTYVVKGDLHNFAYTTGHQFDYISVGSLYGSSNYITANFGNTKWSINYFMIKNNKMTIGTIKE